MKFQEANGYKICFIALDLIKGFHVDYEEIDVQDPSITPTIPMKCIVRFFDESLPKQ